MSDFSKVKLGDVLTFQRGFDITKAEQNLGEVPIVSSSGITSYHNVWKQEPPGVVIGRKGTLGTVHFVSDKYWPHDTTLWIKDFKGNCEKFIYYFLQTLKLENFDAGASNPTLNRNHLHKISVRFPRDVALQKKIGSILSAYDNLIQTNHRRVEVMETAAGELYREWFLRMRFPNHSNVEFDKGFPKTWKYGVVKDLGKIVTGKTPSTTIPTHYGDEFPFIKTPDMHGNMFILSTGEMLSEDGFRSQPSQILPANAICVSCIGTGGVVSITSTASQTNQQINTVILRDQEWLEWAYFALRNLKEMIRLVGATGTTMTNLSKGKFSNLKLFIPSTELILQFHSITSPIFASIKTLTQANNELCGARDAFLGRLISGKLVLPIDFEMPHVEERLGKTEVYEKGRVHA